MSNGDSPQWTVFGTFCLHRQNAQLLGISVNGRKKGAGLRCDLHPRGIELAVWAVCDDGR